ncbi:hypothetical protein E4U51_001857, partial [Claviceps purpurea]
MASEYAHMVLHGLFWVHTWSLARALVRATTWGAFEGPRLKPGVGIIVDWNTWKSGLWNPAPSVFLSSFPHFPAVLHCQPRRSSGPRESRVSQRENLEVAVAEPGHPHVEKSRNKAQDRMSRRENQQSFRDRARELEKSIGFELKR